MRPLIASTFICLTVMPGSLGADQKIFSSRLGDAFAVAAVPTTDGMSLRNKTAREEKTADRLAPPADAFSSVRLADAAPALMPVADAPIDIPPETDTAKLLQPRDLPSIPPAPPKPVVHRSAREVCDTLAQAAQRNDLPVPFFIRLLFQESRFKPGAVSHAGAQGIAQFMPKTADAVGLDNPFDPLEAIPASARLLRNLFEEFGNLGLAAAAYNAGPKRIHDWLARKSSLPKETQGYVKTITGRPPESWKLASAGTPAVKLPERAPCQQEAGLLAYDGPDRIPVPEAAPRREAKLANAKTRHTKTAHAKVAHGKGTEPLRVAARQHGHATLNLAARRHSPARHRKMASRIASAAR
jgi:soluble lytic murein transglycosylase-like protein